MMVNLDPTIGERQGPAEGDMHRMTAILLAAFASVGCILGIAIGAILTWLNRGCTLPSGW